MTKEYLMQKSGQFVYPYGYENTIADLRDNLFSKETKYSQVAVLQFRRNHLIAGLLRTLES